MLATNPSALRVRRTSDISALALPCSTEMIHALVTPTASANWACVQPSVFRRVRMDAPISREVRACTMSSYVDIGRVSTFVVISQCQRSRSSQRAEMATAPSLGVMSARVRQMLDRNASLESLPETASKNRANSATKPAGRGS
jgi:hypothetical protein